MKERGMLFSKPMVLALLDGSKTQTRRVVKGLEFVSKTAPGVEPYFRLLDHPRNPSGGGTPMGPHVVPLCPYGQPGDRLWVRETWNHENFPYGPADPSCIFFYRADYFDDPLGPDLELSGDGIRRKWIPSIHMPRFASRIDLEITTMRVERLQDICEADAIAEGIEPIGCNWRDYSDEGNSFIGARRSYRSLWESLNGAGSWDTNPWVWVITFKRVQP